MTTSLVWCPPHCPPHCLSNAEKNPVLTLVLKRAIDCEDITSPVAIYSLHISIRIFITSSYPGFEWPKGILSTQRLISVSVPLSPNMEAFAFAASLGSVTELVVKSLSALYRLQTQLSNAPSDNKQLYQMMQRMEGVLDEIQALSTPGGDCLDDIARLAASWDEHAIATRDDLKTLLVTLDKLQDHFNTPSRTSKMELRQVVAERLDGLSWSTLEERHAIEATRSAVERNESLFLTLPGKAESDPKLVNAAAVFPREEHQNETGSVAYEIKCRMFSFYVPLDFVSGKRIKSYTLSKKGQGLREQKSRCLNDSLSGDVKFTLQTYSYNHNADSRRHLNAGDATAIRQMFASGQARPTDILTPTENSLLHEIVVRHGIGAPNMLELCQTLLQSTGVIDVDLVNRNNGTALMQCCQFMLEDPSAFTRMQPLASLLIQRGANLSISDNNGQSSLLLMFQMSQGHQYLTQILHQFTELDILQDFEPKDLWLISSLARSNHSFRRKLEVEFCAMRTPAEISSDPRPRFEAVPELDADTQRAWLKFTSRVDRVLFMRTICSYGTVEMPNHHSYNALYVAMGWDDDLPLVLETILRHGYGRRDQQPARTDHAIRCGSEIIDSTRNGKLYLKQLLDAGLALKCEDYIRITAVVHAVDLRAVQSLEHLISVGADAERRRRFGTTALELATSNLKRQHPRTRTRGIGGKWSVEEPSISLSTDQAVHACLVKAMRHEVISSPLATLHGADGSQVQQGWLENIFGTLYTFTARLALGMLLSMHMLR
ncbi:hypothetical protein EDB81DRAFT_766094 [Dactylonectria macrodidyma]|uniref:Ankyrin repeat protein n=1 Tax=Dactylonectria macrodidyma TaxID=307937 RepID=A0A9P9DP81_9HYPO|nr:hypothetical protein EDB81DRAFT_766094 [Dactylonectria macrodidyma]